MKRAAKNQSANLTLGKMQTQGQSEQKVLWQQYCQRLSTIAGVYSNSYWMSQTHEMLKNQSLNGMKSKTKRALDIMNGNNSKLDLINKIVKNLVECRKIQQNQQTLVQQLIELNKQWDKSIKTHFANIYLHEGFSHLQMFKQEEVQDYPGFIDTFESNFDNKKLLQQLEKGCDHGQKDIEI